MFVRKDLNFDEFDDRLATLEGVIDGLDETDKDLWEPAIVRQLDERIRSWDDHLSNISKSAIDNDDEGLVSDLIFERNELEYIIIGILLIKARHPFLMGVSNVERCQRVLHESDRKFKELLGDKREIEYWADSVFWWRHKPW